MEEQFLKSKKIVCGPEAYLQLATRSCDTQDNSILQLQTHRPLRERFDRETHLQHAAVVRNITYMEETSASPWWSSFAASAAEAQQLIDLQLLLLELRQTFLSKFGKELM